MTLGAARLGLETRFADGDPQVTLAWIRSPGILLLGDELIHLADVAELARDFSTEFRAHPRLEYWIGEAAEIPCVEVLDAATGIPLPRYKPRDSRARVAA